MLKIVATAAVLFLIVQVFLPVVSTETDFQFGETSETLTATDGRIRGARNRTGKHFVLGGLFPVHSDSDGGARCGPVRLERGLERMEAMLFALDMVNADPELLPGIELGYDIRDTCNSENIGLDESIDLIITGSQLDIQSCQSAVIANGGNATAEDSFLSAPTSGLVGAASSRVSVPVASLSRLFRTPQVSYASSSAILSNRDRYEFFYRTISPDDQQARAMIDIMLHFNWSYVSTIFSRNPYGEPGIDELHNLAEENNICIDLNRGVDDNFSDEQFEALADDLIASSANIVVLFVSQDEAERLLREISQSSSANRFTWIASDAWARSINVVTQFNETAAGLYGFAPLTEHVAAFNNYFSLLTIDSNQRNPWFPEFYSAVAQCNLTSENASLNTLCDENTNVTGLPQYEQGNFIPLVIDAVYTYAYALQNFMDENCNETFVWFPNNRTCSGQKRELNGSTLLEYIAAVEFNSPTNHRILFDNEGNVEGMYEILNYQATDGTNGREYGFVRVATWDSSVENDTNQQALSMEEGVTAQFGVDSNKDVVLDVTVSQCGRCEPGTFRRFVQSSCCGVCDSCLGGNFSSLPLANSCSVCPDGYWGNNPLTGSNGCVAIPQSFIRFGDALAIIIMLVAIAGILSVTFVAVVFAVFWKTPVIKSSGREQMILLLSGIGLSFVLAFVYVSPPDLGVCIVQRIALWLCFSLMFGSLLVKIVRVARIFLRSTNLSRPRFTEPVYQVLFTFAIVLGELLLVAASIGITVPVVERTTRFNSEDPNDLPDLVVTCVNESEAFLALSAIYQFAIIVTATVLGVLSFKYPKNFNEAKYISFCSFAILVIWVIFAPTYFALVVTESIREFQNVVIAIAVEMSAFSVLLCLFGPKIYISLLKPNSNKTQLSTYTPDDGNLPRLTHGGSTMSLSTISRGGKQPSFCGFHCLGIIMGLYIPSLHTCANLGVFLQSASSARSTSCCCMFA